jgi:hypothetical protein
MVSTDPFNNQKMNLPNILTIAQGIGFIALAIEFYIMQCNHREKMLKFKLMGHALFFLHYFFLGALTGSIVNIVGGIRVYIFKKRFNKNWAYNKILPYIFTIAFLSIGIFTWDGYISLLPVMGMVLGTIAFWSKETKQIRILLLLSIMPWIIYNILVQSYAGIIGSTIILISNFIGIYRFDRPKLFKT